MLQKTSRVNMNQGIRFNEQDILFDDYIYTGDFDITLNLEYASPGFGIGLVNSEGKSLKDKEQTLLFKFGHKSVDIIFSNKDSQKTVATFTAAYAKVYTAELCIKLHKRNNQFEMYIGEQKVFKYDSPFELKTYNLIYYSNKHNVIKHINIASSIPYGWVTNMQNTNGGYISFTRDSFEFKHCLGEAEIEQPDIFLNYGKYYLKYEVEDDSDIIPYVFESDNNMIIDRSKNILEIDNSFQIDYPHKICLKFEGTKGKVKNIHITSQKYGDYYRTSPEYGDKISIDGSKIKIMLSRIKSFSLTANIKHVPGDDHITPLDYAILEINNKNHGIFDLNIAEGIDYKFLYNKETSNILIMNKADNVVKEIYIEDSKINSILTAFWNVNSTITNFVIVDENDESTNIIIENTFKKSVPGTICSPIIAVDENDHPLDLSSSYRVYSKNDKDYYFFTNIEREYFVPSHLIQLTNLPSFKDNSVIVYGIRKGSKIDFDNILRIEQENKDTIDAFANYYDILFEKDLRYINKSNGEIRLTSIEQYEWIVVDYLKSDSYAINYRHEYNSYEVDISIEEEKKHKLLYNNATEMKEGITYINEYRYVNTNIIPSENCYIVIGR